MRLNFSSGKRKYISCLALILVGINIFSVLQKSDTPSLKLIGDKAIFRKVAQHSSRNDWTTADRKPLELQILLWVHPTNFLRQNRRDLMKQISEKMNANGKNWCRPQLVTKQRYDDTCKFSVGSVNISQADAVVFFMFNEGYKLSDLPQINERNLAKPWVMNTIEPPALSKWMSTYKNIFNWTMTYRSDSDLWTPCGTFLKKSDVSSPLLIQNMTLEKWISGKSKFATGVITNCQTLSKREKIIATMQNTSIGKIDIYGKCGRKKFCNRYTEDCSKFWTELAKEYKFYLAFENSLCIEYITEKVYRTLELGLVPGEAPPNSYIDVRDFKSIIELMKYLKRLDDNKEEYAKYFEWRQRFQIKRPEYYWAINDWCALCKAVRDEIENYNSGKPNTKSYKDLNWWFQHDSKTNRSACTKPMSMFKKWLK